ncbi:MAG: hypothetical protein OEV00_11905, partial [Acidobacteriota bacterium]|nr:hypothetical protein [Acidobacteriota bacterium]
MANVLVVAPNREQAKDMRSLLRLDGHHVAVERSVERWHGAEREMRPELVVAHSDSTSAILRHAGGQSRGFPAPLLFIHREEEFFNDTHLNDRLIDRIASPFTDVELLARVDALIRVKQVIQKDVAVRRAWDEPRSPNRSEAKASGGLMRRLGGLLNRRVPQSQLPLGPYLEVAARVADWADSRDAFEPGHAERVTTFCA